MKATKLRKLFTLRSPHQVSAFVFIAATLLLRKDAVGESSHRCHWCGPLAEQIHRSQRASPCNTNDLGSQVTTCEPGFRYCAIVTVGPPYVESRYCVKLYQDECYPLYCNTTNIWKMTCPCRGDLCNGPNKERETNAFAALIKLSKSSSMPSRKKVKGTSNIIKREINSNIEIDTAVTNSLETDDEKLNNEITEIDSQTANVIALRKIDSVTEAMKSNSETNEELPTPVSLERDVSPKDIESEDKAIKKDTEKDSNDCEYETNKSNIEAPTSTTIRQTENEIPKSEPKELHEENTSCANAIKPSEELPTAEALQQNVTPINEVKPTEHITSEITYQTSTITLDQLTEPPTRRNNGITFDHNTPFVVNIIIYIVSHIIV